MPDVVEYRGSYRYADRGTLERALAQARHALDAGDRLPHDRVLLRCFVTDASLTVNLTVPDHGRASAANMLLLLASCALEGAVELGRSR